MMSKCKQCKKNKNILWFFDEIYRQEFMVIFAPNHRKFAELLKKETGFVVEPCEEECVAGQFNELKSKHGDLAVIWASDKNLVLMHETFHACSCILQQRDIWLNPETEESYSYYYCYIMRSIQERLREGGK
jgi:hypothetical protein